MSEFLTTTSTTLVLIALAELGDKSQLVCMTLAARYRRALPIWTGAMLAFMGLNALAVLFGATVAAWLPVWLVAALAALLFAVFGVHALRDGTGGDAAQPAVTGHGMLLSTLLLIGSAEFGDKTQLAVAGLAGTHAGLPVWVGATLALALTTTLGVLAGKTVLNRLPVSLLHRFAGLLFLALAALASWRAATAWPG